MVAKSFNGVDAPVGGQVITFANGRATTPDKPIIPYFDGDGIGPEISLATRRVIDAAVKNAYGDKRQVMWYKIYGGEEATAKFGQLLPQDSLDAILHYGVGIKGPLSTPTGGTQRSLTVQMRKALDLNRCVRPVRYFPGVPSEVKHPEKMNIVIFRENIEDVYAGIEFKFDSPEAAQLRELLRKLGATLRDDTGIGIKIMSRYNSERIVRAAIQHAIDNGLKTVTIAHKGNIQKYTEGAFVEWGYALAASEFADKIVTEADLKSKYNWKMPEGKILLNDRIADAMFAELLLRPERYSVIVTMNLNGDYFSDDAAAAVGGLGIAPGAHIGDTCAMFEATHGTAADIAGQNKANPCSLLLSAVMMLEFFGWSEAAADVIKTIETTIGKATVTGDLARLLPGSTELTTSAFADALIANLPVKVQV